MNETRRLKIAHLSEAFAVAPDVFICCASFEARCTSVPRAIASLGVRDPIIFANEEFLGEVSANMEYLESLFDRGGTRASLAVTDPIRSADVLLKTLMRTTSPSGKRYLVDVTTFTHELLLIMIRILQVILSERDRVDLVYATADDYSVGDEPGMKWLTKGIGEIRSVLGYAGMVLPARKLHLMVLTGFEGERAESLIDRSEASRISVGVGGQETSITSTHYHINRALVERLAVKYPALETFTFSPSNAFDTRDALLKQAQKFPDHNVAIAPMNTKVSTVGAALAAFEDDAIQLCYATAHQYNIANYSVPGNDCLLFELAPLRVLTTPP